MPGPDPGFQVRGGALRKIAPSGGRRENFWGISCEKSRFYAKKSYISQLRRKARKFWGYIQKQAEKSEQTKKSKIKMTLSTSVNIATSASSSLSSLSQTRFLQSKQECKMHIIMNQIIIV
jgi:hypothetical protein